MSLTIINLQMIKQTLIKLNRWFGLKFLRLTKTEVWAVENKLKGKIIYNYIEVERL